MKQFKVARTQLYKVWAEDEEEAKAIFEFRYKQYYARKNNIDILSAVLDEVAEEPWNWQEAQKNRYYEWEGVPEGEPCTATVVVKVLQEKDEQVINKIRKYLEEKYPVKEDEEFISWRWDSLAGEFKLFSCAFGDNFYDYGEEPKEFSTDDIELKKMLEEYPEYFYILDCSECCGCAGW